MEFKIPTETIELPSKGLLYPEDSALREGKVEMKYMTAKEEDILTNQSYIQKGTVLDKLLQSLIVTKINYNELLIGDKNALMVAARVLGYGKEYKFTYRGEEVVVDLSKVENKPLHPEVEGTTSNEFKFTLPSSGNEITFKILSHGDETQISQEIEGLKKLNKDTSSDLTTRLKYILTSINGSREKKDIRQFVDTALLATDSRALRNHISEISPDVDLTFFPEPGGEKANIPVGLSFFWPDI